MPFTYEFERPAITVEIVCFCRFLEELKVLMIRRGKEPYKGKLAVPGGHLERDEDVFRAAQRELHEETNLDVEERDLNLVTVLSGPNRDPRGWYVGCLFVCEVLPHDAMKAKAGDDAAAVEWIRASGLGWLQNLHKMRGEIAFDHIQSIILALESFYGY